MTVQLIYDELPAELKAIELEKDWAMAKSVAFAIKCPLTVRQFDTPDSYLSRVQTWANENAGRNSSCPRVTTSSWRSS